MHGNDKAMSPPPPAVMFAHNASSQGATRALVVKFADVKKTHTAKGWLVPEGRGPSPIGYNGVRQGNPANYWQPTAPPSGGGGGGGPRDVYPKGRDVYAAPYPYPVCWNWKASLLVLGGGVFFFSRFRICLIVFFLQC